MGKKLKVGKQRKDKYYQLAKETGYRSRAAFKLIQLNRKYGFLQKSKVLIDLCAAPGGWLQVASQHMPVSSVIIGVDLVPIRPIHNVITFEDDITKASCRQSLKKHLQTWKADVVLNDGAPNVGQNWLHDAFQQAQLTLQALKLATEFLVKGGWFITKVFRSKDYHALLWVFKQFFKKVYATKPQASRTESAEIFVVCQNFIAPDKIDAKLLDPKYVFEEVDPEPKAKLNIMNPEKKKRKAEGYSEGATASTMLFKATPVSKFIENANCVEILTETSQFVFDDPRMENHPETTEEVKECCKDIKVLGRKELRLLLSWRKKLREVFVEDEKDKETKVIDEELEEDDETKLEREVEELKMEEALDKKRKKKKVLKEKKKLHDKMNLKMIIPDEEPITQQEDDLFRLTKLKKKELSIVEKGDQALLDEEINKIEMDEDSLKPRKKKVTFYDKDEKDLDGLYSDEEEAESSEDEENLGRIEDDEGDDLEFETESEEEDEKANPLVVDLDTSSKSLKEKRRVDFWFGKESFEGVENEDDEDLELEKISKYYEEKRTLESNGTEDKDKDQTEDESEDDDSDSSGDDDDDDKVAATNENGITQTEGKKKLKRNLDTEGLALGGLLIQSKKTKRDLIDNGWNRFSYGDEDAPDWFKKDEEKHNKKQIPVTKEMMAEFRERLKEINARPIGKVAEAKARKKKRAMRKMEKARKKAEHITEAIDMTDREKVQQIKTIYKKAGMAANKKKEVKYVVSRKAFASKRASRPAGLKGPYKVVDPRLKKDNRKKRLQEKNMKKGKGGKKAKKTKK